MSFTKSRGRSKPAAGPATRFRLAIFDLCDEGTQVDFVGRVLTDCPEDRRYAREAIAEYNAYVAKLDGCTYAMGLFKIGV